MNKHKTEGITIFIICLYLVIPIVFTFLYSIVMEWNEVMPKGLTFRYYIQIFSDMEFIISILRSIIISVVPIVICTAVILPAMYVVVVHIPALERCIQILCTIPYAIQGIILAVSVLALYADAPFPFSDHIIMLIAAYCIFILPYIYQGIKNSLNAINANRLIEAAQMLGASKLYAYFFLIIPNILSGITVAAMLSASIIFGDFIVVNIIGGNYFVTSQMYLYRALYNSGQLASAISVVLFSIILILSLAALYLKKRNLTSPEEKR